MQAGWTNISDPIFHWAKVRPERLAICEDHLSLTYGELAPLVARAAVHLAGMGIAAGDRVAISLTNSTDHLILLLGLLRLGATTVEIPYEADAPSAATLAKFAVRTIFLEPAATPPADVVVIRVDGGWRGLIARAQGDRRHPGNGDDVFTINLTSGTTGTPKGSLNPQLRCFQRLAARAELFAESEAFSPARPANFLLTSSLGFSVFFQLTLGQLAIGGTVVIVPELRNAIDLAKAIARREDVLCYLPSDMSRLLIACAPAQGFLLPNVRALIGGGGFLYPQEKLAMLGRVTPNFYYSYGASGFGMLSAQRPSEMRARPASAGRPPSSIKVQAVGPTEQPLPPGEIGRLRCRGTEGWGLGPDERFHDGWYYSGDIGHLDAEGYIFLKGRDADVIARAGDQVFAADIEQVIALHPSVAEVAVVGLPQPFAGEEVVALVVAHGEAQHEALAQHCRKELPPTRWPERVFYAQALPKTPAGKLDRNQVKNLIMNEIVRQSASAQQQA